MMEQLEGKIGVEAALRARQRKIHLLVLRNSLHEETTAPLIELAESQHVPVKWVSREELDAMAHGHTHGGVLALCSPKPQLTADQLFHHLHSAGFPHFLLLLEGVDDSQNLGFVLRTAEACGVDAVLLKKHLWDFDGAAVSRASSGAFERLPICIFDQAAAVLPKFSSLGVRIYGCIANAQRTMYQVDLAQSVLIALGGEKRGLSAAVRDHCDRFIKIPMLSAIGSLSLSHASAILLAEVMRQRLSREETPPDPRGA
jgi:23S rRNA (guanosine2251-2'-O)-methyltransferase